MIKTFGSRGFIHLPNSFVPSAKSVGNKFGLVFIIAAFRFGLQGC